jgi:hypothetical protein
MVRRKPIRIPERIEVLYDEDRWRLLKELRTRAIGLMKALQQMKIYSIVHGSVARGDVTYKSDVDVFVPYAIPHYLIEEALDVAGITVRQKVIVQATPSYAVKGYLEIDERTAVSFSLSKLRSAEYDFYKFGGCIDLAGLNQKKRVPGVDKRLMLIEPTSRGHIESSIMGREEIVAKLLDISVRTVKERIRTLLRRERVGRTGVFLKKVLKPNEDFSSVLRKLARDIPSLRKRLV